jgi:hypothetical protein
MSLFDVGSSIASGFIDSNAAGNASQAQVNNINKGLDLQRRNFLTGALLQDPTRYSGYQAQQDVNNFFGYDTPAYTSPNQLLAQMTPLGAKQTAKYLKKGMSLDQISGMGTLDSRLSNKQLKRLTKAGLSPEQIQQLQMGQQQPMQQAPQSQGGGGGENWDVLRNSSDYQFAVQEGQRGIGGSFAARGGATSGNALRALEEFRQGLASQQIDKFLSRRGVQIDRGIGATNNVQNGATGYANNATQLYQDRGDARASGILGRAGATIGAISGVAGAVGGGGYGGQDGGYGGWGSGGGGWGGGSPGGWGSGVPGVGSWPGTPPFIPGGF